MLPWRNDVVGEGQAGERIVDRDRRPGCRVRGVRKIAGALRRGRHQTAEGTPVSGTRKLIVDIEAGLGAIQQMRYLERSAEHHAGAQLGVCRLGSVLPGKRERPRIQRRVVEAEVRIAVVLRAAAAAAIAERCLICAASTASLALPEAAAAAAHHAATHHAAATAATGRSAHPRLRVIHSSRTGEAVRTPAAAGGPIVLLRLIQTVAHTAVHEQGIGALIAVGARVFAGIL